MGEGPWFTGRSRGTEDAVKVALIVLCFFFPFLAVLLHGDSMKKVLIALVLQLLGHFPGVIYGLVQITRD